MQGKCFSLRRGSHVKTQLTSYHIYYADDDMFRPLWTILRSQKCIQRKAIRCKIISIGTYSELSNEIALSFGLSISNQYYLPIRKVVKVLCYKSEGRWFDRSWSQ